MNKAEFESRSVTEQLSLVSATSADGDHQYFQWFCQIHDPSNPDPQDELLASLEEQVIEEDFLDRFELVPPKSFPLEYVQMLRLLSRIDGQECAICKKERNFLQNLAVIMNLNPRNVELLEHGCKIVGLLASVSPVSRQGIREAIAESGVTAALAKILKEHPTNTALVVAACKALNNAVYIHVTGKLAFLESGAFRDLIRLFSIEGVDISAKRYAAMLLRAIVHLGDERLCLFDAGIPLSASPLQDIVDVMVSTDDATVRLHAIWAALNITINMGDAKKAFGRAGGIHAITTCLELHKTDAQLQLAACIAFQQMATKKYNRIAIGKGTTLKEIVHIITIEQPDFDILQTALGALERVSVSAVCRVALSSSSVLPVLFEVFNFYKGNVDLMFQALAVCHELGQHANATKKAMREHGLVEFLCSIISLHSNEPQLCSLAKKVSSLVLAHAEAENEDSVESESSSEADDDGYPDGHFEEEPDVSDLQNIMEDNKALEMEIQRCKELSGQHKEMQRKHSLQIQKLNEQDVSLFGNKSDIQVINLAQANTSLQKTIDDDSLKIAQLDEDLNKGKIAHKKIQTELQQLHANRERTKQNHQIEIEKLTAQQKLNEELINAQAARLCQKEDLQNQLEAATALINTTKQRMGEWMAIAVKLDQMCATGATIDFDKEIIEKMMLKNIDRALS